MRGSGAAATIAALIFLTLVGCGGFAGTSEKFFASGDLLDGVITFGLLGFGIFALVILVAIGFEVVFKSRR